MECTEEVEFAKSRASADSGACAEVGFHKAVASWTGNCVEVGFSRADEQSGCDQVHVRNSRFPDRVVNVPHGQWQQLVAESQTSGRVRLTEWFPEEFYGDFAMTFFANEEAAFESGVLGNEPQLVGNR